VSNKHVSKTRLLLHLFIFVFVLSCACARSKDTEADMSRHLLVKAGALGAINRCVEAHYSAHRRFALAANAPPPQEPAQEGDRAATAATRKEVGESVAGVVSVAVVAQAAAALFNLGAGKDCGAGRRR
jgi:hypothetical protein